MFKHPDFFRLCNNSQSRGSYLVWALSAHLRLWPFAVAGREDKTDSRQCAADSHNLAGSYKTRRAPSGGSRTGEANSSHDPARELVGCPQEMHGET